MGVASSFAPKDALPRKETPCPHGCSFPPLPHKESPCPLSPKDAPPPCQKFAPWPKEHPPCWSATWWISLVLVAFGIGSGMFSFPSRVWLVSLLLPWLRSSRGDSYFRSGWPKLEETQRTR